MKAVIWKVDNFFSGAFTALHTANLDLEVRKPQIFHVFTNENSGYTESDDKTGYEWKTA